MASFKDQYSKVGINLIRHFIEPPIIVASSYVFPDNAILHWFKPTDGIEKISRKFPYLSKTNKANVITPTKYSLSTSGSFKLDLDKVKDGYNILQKEEKRFNFLKPDTIETNTNSLLIYNYGLLNYVNDYTNDIRTPLFRYENVSNRLFEDLKSLNNNSRFILIDLPIKLPTISELDTFANRLAVGNISKLDYRHFNLIELWKWLTPNLKSSSMFNKVANHKLANTTLLFSIDTKIALLNLEVLYNMVDEYKDNKYSVNTESLYQDFLSALDININQEDLTKVPNTYPADMIRSLLYIFLYQLLNGKSVSLDKVKQEVIEIDKKSLVKTVNKLEKQAKVSISGIIDNYIIEEKIDMVDLSTDTDIEDSFFDISKYEADEASLRKGIERVFNSVEDLKQYKYQDEVKANKIKEIEYLYNNKLISKKQYQNFLDHLEKQDKIKNPYLTTETIDKSLDFNSDVFEIEDKDVKVAKSVILFDEAVSKNVLGNIEKKYLQEQYRKDIIRSVYSLQNHGNIILDYKVDTRTDIMGTMEEHRIEVVNMAGKKTTLTFEIPYIDENGNFSIGSSNYVMRTQRIDQYIRKIDATTVTLTSYYGKLFISKANANNKNVSVGKWFLTMLTWKQYENKQEYDKKLTNINAEGSMTPDVKLPLLYAQIASYVRYFTYDGWTFNFNYDRRFNITDNYNKEEIINLEGKDLILLASKGKDLIFIDFSNTLYQLDKGKMKDIGNFFDFINVDSSTMPIEYAGMVLLKEYIPLVFLLSYYLGLDNLLKMLKIKYTLYDNNKRVELTNDQYSVRFKDKKLVIDKDKGIGDIILGGLLISENKTKTIPYSALNNRATYGLVFNKLFKMESNVRYVNEIKLLESMFIDPMTLNLLKINKDPESFVGLLIKAAELLLDNNYKHPNNLNDMVLKGYERIAGLIYKELVLSLKDYENKSAFTRVNFTMDRYAILNKLNEDSTKVVVDDLNPIALIKQKEDLSYLGHGGRNKDTMVKSTRELHTTEIGVVSEATKDSSNVGITAYMTATPMIDNTRGIIKDNSNEHMGWQNRLSTPGMLSPFGLTDDAKRLKKIGAVTWETV